MYNELFKRRTRCRICNSNHLTKILDLGETPLADRFIDSPNEEEFKFPLEVAVCTKCWLVQLLIDVQDKLLFGDNYGFYSGASPSSIDYFKRYAGDILRVFPKRATGYVVEIASNDGTMLKHFIDFGASEVLGVEPAKNIVKYAKGNGVPTLPCFFSKKIGETIAKTRKADLIIANNVVAHVIELNDFMQGIKALLADNGVFVFEVQYAPYLIFNCEYDNVYHEHRSFFSVTPLNRLLEQNFLEIFDIQETPAQGGSVRVFARHLQSKENSFTAEVFMLQEREFGLTRLDIYKSLQDRANYASGQLVEILQDLRNLRAKVYGYGASAKSNTLLNYCRIGPELLECVVDKTPFKFGKYTPGSHIVIRDQDKANRPDFYLLLVWNYLDGVLKREKKFRKKGGKFIVPMIPLPKIL